MSHLLLIWLLASASPAAKTTDASPPDAWPVARGTASACGVAGSTLPDKPVLLWTFTVENQGFQAGAVIEGGSVYVASAGGTLYSVDLATGKKRWEYAGKSSYMTTPAVRDGRVLVGDQDGDFACFDAKSGKMLWKHETDGPIDSPANFYRDCVLFGSEDSNEYCFNAASGKLVWKFDMEDQVRCLATIAGNRGYFATCGAMLYTVDLDKGAAVGKVPIDAPTGCAAALGKDRVFVGNEEGQFLAVDLVKGAIAWQLPRPRPRDVLSFLGSRHGRRHLRRIARQEAVRLRPADRQQVMGILHPRNDRQLAGSGRRSARYSGSPLLRLAGRADLWPRSPLGQGSLALRRRRQDICLARRGQRPVGDRQRLRPFVLLREVGWAK